MELISYLEKQIDAIKIGRKLPSKDVNICIDAGSTGTRSILFYTKDIANESSEQEILETDTPVISVKRKIPSMIRTTKDIGSNLECVVKMPDNTEWHFVKGKLRNKLSGNGEGMVAAESKIDQELLYESILFQTALHVMLDSLKTSTEADVYNVSLTLALPPEDLMDERQEKIINRLTGMSTVSFPRLKKNVAVNIHSIEIYAEPEAAAYYYTIRTNTVDENIIFIDCGGRSQGACIIKNNDIIQEATTTNPGGGERMIKELAQSIADVNGINIQNTDTIRAALSTGKIRIGTDTIDIAEDISYVKENLAEECVSTIYSLLDKSKTKMEEVQRIVCTGRTFKPTKDADGNVISESLVMNIKDKLSYSGINITIEFFSEPNPIVKGLYFHAVMSIAEREGMLDE